MFMQKAIEYIKTNWQQGKSLKEIAKIHKIDPGNLERSFRNTEGITVKHYTDGKRKEYLMQLISRDDAFGYEMGTRLGFKTDRAFYRWVKRAFGISYRQLRSDKIIK
jgi:two-component system response regulator YesN